MPLCKIVAWRLLALLSEIYPYCDGSIMKKLKLLAALLIACLVVVENAAIGAPITLQALDSGWYRGSDGYHNPDNTSYFVGESTDGEYRNFFVFDKPTNTPPIVSASLRLQCPSLCTAPFPSLYTLYDVTTPIADLVAGGAGKFDIFADLGTGVSVGSFVIPVVDGAVLTIMLNAEAVSLLDEVNGPFAFGGTLGSGQAFFGPGSLGCPPDCVRELVLVVDSTPPGAVPIPAAAWLLGAGLVGLIGITSRKRKT